MKFFYYPSSSKNNLSLSQDQDVSAGKGKKLDGSSIGSRFTDSSKEKSIDQKTTEEKDGPSSNEKEETEEEKEQKVSPIYSYKHDMIFIRDRICSSVVEYFLA